MRATSLDSGDGLRVAAVLCPGGGSGTAEPRLLGLGEKRVFRGYYHDDVPIVVEVDLAEVHDPIIGQTVNYPSFKSQNCKGHVRIVRIV